MQLEIVPAKQRGVDTGNLEEAFAARRGHWNGVQRSQHGERLPRHPGAATQITAGDELTVRMRRQPALAMAQKLLISSDDTQ